MRYAVLSDVHANLEALRAVLADAADRSDAVFCLGDVVGYGADPAACIDLVGERCQAVVGGNHERAVAGQLDLDWFNPHARAAAEVSDWIYELDPKFVPPVPGLLGLCYRKLGFRPVTAPSQSIS